MSELDNLLQQELNAIKARLAKAAKSEAEALKLQFGERIAHLEERLGIKPAEAPATPPSE